MKGTQAVGLKIHANVIDMNVNGVSLPKADYNALVTGCYDVPVVFVSRDQAFVEQGR